MAHWAELDENNVVIRVTVGDNNDPSEGYDWIIENLGGRWIQTSYNSSIRGKFAGVGDTYDERKDEFISPPRTNSETISVEENTSTLATEGES
jgi:hypothetical protein